MRLKGIIAAFSAIAAFAVTGLPDPAEAARADAAYTIGNYPVEAADKNAVAAKEKALTDGQKAAFRALLKRIVPVTAYKQISRLSSVNAANLVSGVSVRSERNSSTEYIASLDFAFQADAVRSALQSQGVPFVDVQAEPVVLIPVMSQGNPPEAKSDTGPWRAAWKGLDLTNTLTPVTLETLKPVIHADTVKMLTDGDDSGLRIMSREYNNQRVILAIFEPDLAAKKVVVTLAGEDASGPILLKRTYRVSDGDLAYTSELAAVVALGVLEGRWKTIKSGAGAATQNAAYVPEQPAWSAGDAFTPTGSGESVAFVVEFNGPDQWNDMRTQILDTPGVDGVNISAATEHNADVALRFPGGAAALANAVGARGLSLINVGSGWILRSTN